MKDIPNTEYITINKDGIFVGGKPAVKYHGEKIALVDLLKVNFADIQKENPKVQELHVAAFKSEGNHAEPGNPSGRFFGRKSAWCRVNLSDGRLGPWMFSYTFDSVSDCAKFCAVYCSYDVRDGSDMRSAVLKTVQNVR